jgi:hypothetical protein
VWWWQVGATPPEPTGGERRDHERLCRPALRELIQLQLPLRSGPDHPRGPELGNGTNLVDGRLLDLALWLLDASPDDVYDFGYGGCDRCQRCGRALAAADCATEPDLDTSLRMCRSAIGVDKTCRPGLRGRPPAAVGPWHEDPTTL